MTRHLLIAIACALALPPAVSPAEQQDKREDSGKFVFSILPKSLQKHPQVDFNVITEMTDSGRTVRAPAPGSPVHYVTRPGGFLQLGHGAAAREKPPEVGKMELVLRRALAAAGYLPASESQPASLVIIYSWGSHSNPLDDGTGEDPAVTNKVLIDEMIERARLVGGERFAAEFVRAMAEAGAARAGTYRPREDPSGAVAAIPDARGSAPAMMTGVFNPVERFRNRDARTRDLMDDVGGSVYFVVASAYDFDSVATERRVLLWRTKMTVNSRGVSMTETLPALVAAGAPYFGRDMESPEIVTQRLNRDGQVEIGTPTVVGFGEPAPGGTSPRP